MPKTVGALPHASLDVLTLKTLARGPRHDYALAKYIEAASADIGTIERRRRAGPLEWSGAAGYAEWVNRSLAAAPSCIGGRARSAQLTAETA